MRYFFIIQGLRGCYMPVDSYAVACGSQEDLRALLVEVCADYRTGFRFGGAQKDIRRLAAEVWSRPNERYEFVLPFGDRAGDRPYAVAVSNASESDYREAGESEAARP